MKPDIKGIRSFGVAGLVVSVSLLLIYTLYSGIRNRFGSKEEVPEQRLRVITVPIEEVQPVIHTLPAGKWSDWYLIMGRKVSIVPADALVTYELKDARGNVRVEKEAREWNDSTLYERFKSDREIQFFVERL